MALGLYVGVDSSWKVQCSCIYGFWFQNGLLIDLLVDFETLRNKNHIQQSSSGPHCTKKADDEYSQAGLEPGSCPTFPSPNPHYNSTFCSFNLMLSSGGKQRRISKPRVFSYKRLFQPRGYSLQVDLIFFRRIKCLKKLLIDFGQRSDRFGNWTFAAWWWRTFL